MDRVTPLTNRTDPFWWLADARAVPPADTPGCCRTCRGTTGGPGYNQCWRCGVDWASHPEYDGAIDLITPCTVTVDPSRWYNALRGYKRTNPSAGAQATALQTALISGLRTHHDTVITALGGPVDIITVVPPSRASTPSSLLRTVQAIRTRRAATIATAEFHSDRPIPKHQLLPDLLAVDADVHSKRVVLIEDTWVSGSRAVSTAIALHRVGAGAIVVVPIARKVDIDAMTDQYAAATVTPGPANPDARQPTT